MNTHTCTHMQDKVNTALLKDSFLIQYSRHCTTGKTQDKVPTTLLKDGVLCSKTLPYRQNTRQNSHYTTQGQCSGAVFKDTALQAKHNTTFPLNYSRTVA